MTKILWRQNQGYYPVIQASGGLELAVEHPIDILLLSGEVKRMQYDTVDRYGDDQGKADGEQSASGGWTAYADLDLAGYKLKISDRWTWNEKGHAEVYRSLRAERWSDSSGQPGEPPVELDGIQLRMRFVREISADTNARFHAPAILYGSGDQTDEHLPVTRTYMDDRLTYPLIVSHEQGTGTTVMLARTVLSTHASAPVRDKGQNRFLQRTDTGSIGYTREAERVIYEAYVPYYEGERSAALTADQVPASAFYPLLESAFELSAGYTIQVSQHEQFADAVFSAFDRMAKHAEPHPVDLPFTLEDSIRFRSESLKASYRELPSGAAGFFFHFDPRLGYRSAPSGFGASFVNIPHDSYQSVLEYGFTGRQLNAAYEMAVREGGEWWDKGKKVIDFFVNRCTTPSGWMYTLFEVNEDRPFPSFGDPTAPKLHYVSHGTTPGNYLRLMVEPAFDLLRAYQSYREHGVTEEAWYEAVRRFADFLVRHQNDDGSWYRAFQPDGTPLMNGPGFGDDDFSAKSGTAIPIMFLLALWEYDPERGSAYKEAALRAARFVLDTYVAYDHYQGGTLDNPNVIDKEAVQYVTAALYTLYRYTKEPQYLEGADRAAKLFVTWNYIWKAPTIPGTDLHKVDFNTIGCGGINSIWGGGVVDIYSLFFIRELYQLGLEVDNPFYCKMADWIAIGTQQLLSHPGDHMGFTDIGMQPEGFGICNQGSDEGLITKGDIWGTLGWIYSAGILGLGRYLDVARNES